MFAVVLIARPRSAGPLLSAAGDRPPITARIAIGAAGAGGLLDIVGLVAFAIRLEQAPTWIVGLASSFGPVVSVLVAVMLP